MTDDPIIEEVHRTKDELARVHAGDLHSLFETLREIDARADRAIVSGLPVKMPLRKTLAADLPPGGPHP
jgi:hypothetical protein